MRLLFAAFLFLTVIVSAPLQALACRMTTPPVTQKDLVFAPDDMLAVIAEIIETDLPSPFFRYMPHYPHGGFHVKVKILDRIHGGETGEVISVAYSPCHDVPGSKGDTINVLARKNKTGQWKAPQKWDKIAPKLTATFKTLEDMEALPEALPPIYSPQKAAGFAARYAPLMNELQKAQSQAGYTAWKIDVSGVATMESISWDVRISSAGKILPSFACTAKLTSNGILADDAVRCRYNK